MELAIGATIIAGVIILIVMLMAWGNTSSLLGGHYRVVVNMTNIGGLKEGAPVKLGGFQIGRVSSIQLRPGGTDMEIVLDIDEDRLLPKGSTAKVSTAGLVGDAFMEIIPGKSAQTIRRSSTVAEAERMESSPLPDMSELFTKITELGDQLTILTTNVNDVVGDANFRRSLKSMATNIDAVSYQANLILQRGQGVIDNIQLASQNVAKLSDTLKVSVETVTADIERVSESAIGTMDTVHATVKDVQDAVKPLTDAIATAREVVEGTRTTVAKANDTIDNINGGVSDARAAINNTVGNPQFAADLRQTITNINSVTALLAERRQSMDLMLSNVGDLSTDLRAVASNIKLITGNIEPAALPNTLATLNSAIASLTEVVELIKKEPVLALSINKAADRIVKMKFDEMAKQQQFRNADAVLDEINRWVRASMERGSLLDPAYRYEDRPYRMKQQLR